MFYEVWFWKVFRKFYFLVLLIIELNGFYYKCWYKLLLGSNFDIVNCKEIVCYEDKFSYVIFRIGKFEKYILYIYVINGRVRL